MKVVLPPLVPFPVAPKLLIVALPAEVPVLNVVVPPVEFAVDAPTLLIVAEAVAEEAELLPLKVSWPWL